MDKVNDKIQNEEVCVVFPIWIKVSWPLWPFTNICTHQACTHCMLYMKVFRPSNIFIPSSFMKMYMLIPALQCIVHHVYINEYQTCKEAYAKQYSQWTEMKYKQYSQRCWYSNISYLTKLMQSEEGCMVYAIWIWVSWPLWPWLLVYMKECLNQNTYLENISIVSSFVKQRCMYMHHTYTMHYNNNRYAILDQPVDLQ